MEKYISALLAFPINAYSINIYIRSSCLKIQKYSHNYKKICNPKQNFCDLLSGLKRMIIRKKSPLLRVFSDQRQSVDRFNRCIALWNNHVKKIKLNF